MGKNLLGKLRRNEIECVHELFENFIIGGLILDFKERLKEQYNRSMDEIGKMYGRFRRYL